MHIYLIKKLCSKIAVIFFQVVQALNYYVTYVELQSCPVTTLWISNENYFSTNSLELLIHNKLITKMIKNCLIKPKFVLTKLKKFCYFWQKHWEKLGSHRSVTKANGFFPKSRKDKS